MVGNPGDLVRVQARIECMQHAPSAADAEIQFQMPVTVPGQRRNTVPECQIQGFQGIGNLA